MDRVGINGCNNDSNEVDLTLKLATPLDLTLRLGLPDLPYNFSQNPRRHNLPQTTNLSLLGPNIQGMNPLGMVTRGATLPPPPGFHGPPRYARSVTLFSGPLVGFTSSNTNRYMLPDLNNNPPTAVPRRRRRTIGPMSHQHELIPPYNFLPIPRRRRQRQARNNIDPNKRCTNNSCNTDDTPMWRNGPLGHKTLCNACGIRYKNQEDIRKAIEAAGTGSQTAQPNPN